MNIHVNVAAAALAAVLAAQPARASLVWNWSYTGPSITASGTLQTTDTANQQGFYQIIDIEGTRNGVAIIGLQPAGTAIPGNQPFTVDNLIREAGPGQITVQGLGFALASGAFANPFFADYLLQPSYFETFTQSGSSVSVTPMTFTASRLQVPEPTSIGLAALALAMLGLSRRPATAASWGLRIGT